MGPNQFLILAADCKHQQFVIGSSFALNGINAPHELDILALGIFRHIKLDICTSGAIADRVCGFNRCIRSVHIEIGHKRIPKRNLRTKCFVWYEPFIRFRKTDILNPCSNLRMFGCSAIIVLIEHDIVFIRLARLVCNSDVQIVPFARL